MLPTTFWAEAVNTACYVQNRVLVTKPHNKTPYKLFLGRKPALGFMRPFGCLVTILNTNNHLGSLMLLMRILIGKMETVPGKDYILLPLWPVDPLLSQSSKSSFDDGFKPLGDYEKKITKEPGKEGGDSINAVGIKSSIDLPDDLNMPELEDIVYSYDDEDVGTKACKKQTMVANSTIEAEYVAASSCCGQVLWIQNQLLDYGLKLRVKKLEKKRGSRTHKLRRLYKVGRTARVVSSDEASLGDQEDASKHGRKIHDIDADEDITLENVHDAEMFDVNDLQGDEVFVNVGN
ncbi:putative ribonuclease H-like domain-containing protein [Tanacetum coccineum]